MSSSNNNKLPADAPEPRLCHLIKWPDFDGYGFNLHAEKSRTGQFIGKVDEGSPAQSAGLKEGDRIVEVNGVNIAQENHRQVVERIKSIANETQLLVVDPVADRWYKERKLVVKSTLPNVLSLKTPVQQPPAGEPPCYENIAPQNHATNGSAIENGVHERDPSPSPPPKLPTKHDGKQKQNGTTHANGTTTPVEKADVVEIKQQDKSNDSPIQNTKEKANDSRSSTPMDNNTSIADSPRSTKSSRSTNSAGASSNGPASLEDGILNLNMSASEMRQMLANRRKKDPKKEQMDIRQKYEIIQQM